MHLNKNLAGYARLKGPGLELGPKRQRASHHGRVNLSISSRAHRPSAVTE
jgi:hypothetical protein